jgi:hypothetical protein
MMVRSCAESEMERYAQGYRRRRDIAVIRIKEFVKINSGWVT